MIVFLDPGNKETAEELLQVQIPAYRKEAERIKFDGIPYLHDTVKSIQSSKESFIGFKEEQTLVGVLAYEQTDEDYVISRLFVDPEHFRKGIAKALLGFFMKEIVRNSKPVTVTSGTENAPAINFYEKSGFFKMKEVIVQEGVSLTMLKMSP
ncbi:GNAT family N-acetyltransferase [Virgibacillus senegalensis]|uniref:GNAT family N-acetyltransferase n=1 Tax=Virgibacillus senegalensis TaxID=1499679 RepID=UPI00069CD485|nr:GNAT family N-acetyltransferase [Virgibacillus senegalensis]